MLKCKTTNGKKTDKWQKLGKAVMWYYGCVYNNVKVQIYNKEKTNFKSCGYISHYHSKVYKNSK